MERLVSIMQIYDKHLFIFEMANNHQGSVEHGKLIMKELKTVCQNYTQYFNFAVKFQYRNLDTFIHPDYQGREDIKNVKRFQDTRLSVEQMKELQEEAKRQGFYTICTPFDEDSVKLIKKHEYDVLKIASCSFTDWQLLEKIGRQGMPVIASAAGSSFDDITKVVNFFKNRKVDFSLMHCIAEYPTRDEDLQMNQIDYYKKNFNNIRIGFSTHESPDNMEPVKIAIAKGAVMLEKHVGVETDEISLNAYSATPAQVGQWLAAALNTWKMCGVENKRYEPNAKEVEDLTALRRGAFAKTDLETAGKVESDDLFLAFPCQEGQLLANHLSKYTTVKLKNKSVAKNKPIMLEDVEIINDVEKFKGIVAKVLDILKKSNVVIPVDSTCEISHHYGVENFYETGVTMINCINREYCKKILVVLPGQNHPRHIHKMKEETFTVLYGELEIDCNGLISKVAKGESMVVERGVNHGFCSQTGCVFEEISTTHYSGDSYYEFDDFDNPRKTEIYITKEMLEDFVL